MATNPRILFLDIETFPSMAAVWSLYEANALEVKRHRLICCFSAKWYGGKQITKALPDYSDYKPDAVDDYQLVSEIGDLLDQADIVVGHNGKRFDIPIVNARLVKHNLFPPSTYKTIDTKLVASKIFGFGANTLNNLCDYLGIGQKIATGGYELWQGCMAGDLKAWARMKKYNAYDVTLLEKLYVRLLPWINDHPNYSLYREEECCTKCGSTKLQSRRTVKANTRLYRRMQCTACGGWMRSTLSIGKTLLTNA